MTAFDNMNREELISELTEKASALDELEKYRVLFNSSPEAIIFSTLEGEILDCNDRACELYGYSREALLSLSLWELWTYEHVSKFPERIVEEQKYGGMNVVETHKKQCGGEFPAEVFTRLIDINGDLYRWSVIHDLTDFKKQSDDHIMSDGAVHDMMMLLPELIGEPDIVIETDLEGMLVSANQMFYTKTGYTEEDMKRGLHTSRLYLPEFRDSVEDTTKRILSGEPPEIRERTFLRKDGTEFPVMVYSTPIDESGEISGTRVFAIDTTEHKQIEKDMLNMERFHALGQVSGGVMHDLNNILSIILGYTEIFSQKGLHSSDQRLWADFMDKIKRAATDGVQILKRIRNFSTLDTIQSYSPLHIKSVIDEVVELLEPRLYNNGNPDVSIHVVKDLSPVPPVTGNASELREVLSNLIINAVDAMPEGGTITIHATAEYDNVIISVTDTGTGMTEETKASLFKPFFTTKGNKGTGLGLYISRDILQKLGGELLCESREGSGSTFKLIIPAADIRKAPAEQKPPVAPVATPKGRHILVIDDEASICDILKEFFEMSGFIVDTSGDGGAGLERFESICHDIVITDLNMPHHSGLDIARHVKKLAPDTTVIMITGSLSGIKEMHSFDIIDHVLPKPIDFEELSSLMASLTNS